MNPSAIQSKSATTYFTLGYFEDSNWYPKINYAFSDHMEWGYKRGCNFLDTCNNTYPEYMNEDE